MREEFTNMAVNMAFNASAVACYAFLPWSIPAFLGALAIYEFSGARKEDYSGDAGLAVLAAPALPLICAVAAIDWGRDKLKG